MANINEMYQMRQGRAAATYRPEGNDRGLDFSEGLAPKDGIGPADPRESRHLETAATQRVFAGFEPTSSSYYGALLFPLTKPAALATPAREISAALTRYEDIRPVAPTSPECLTLASKS
ncbi:hypothetical protein DL765_002115 [Monosporascus sp. GIB2]|nr:hypothetical protein DL765_002115 [Monosporascus sp. GIB2]